MGGAEFVGGGDQFERAVVQQRDAGGQHERLADVVGDEEGGLVDAAAEVEEQALEFEAGDGVERGEGLVEQEQGRVGGEGAGDADALLLPAGEMARIAAAEFSGRESDGMEQFSTRAAMRSGGQPSRRGDEADVGFDRPVREEAAVLDDVAHAAAEADGVPFGGGRPSKWMVPADGGIRPLTVLRSVVLPEPLRPSRTMVSPFWTSRVMLRRIGRLESVQERSRIARTGSGTVFLW